MAAPINLGGLFNILPDTLLPELASPGTIACAVNGRNGDGLFALVCDRNVPVRLNILQKIIKIEDGTLIRLLHSGIAVWPEDGTERVMMVFERPAGGRLLELDSEKPGKPVVFDHLVHRVITPVVGLLEAFADQGLYHGAIRPDNLFGLPNLNANVVLGECVTVPAGYYQPILFETMQRGLAQPDGRGNGTTSDDLYAFGVTLLCLALGRSPLPNKKPDEILQLKMDKGSFYALVPHNRVPTGLLEPLRGLLGDDPATRWTLDDCRQWLGGRRCLSPRPPEAPKRSVRPFDFNSKEIWTARGLARELAYDTFTAYKLIDTGEVESWMRRALGEKNDTEFLVTELAQSKASGRGPRDVDMIFARCSMAISPDSPIRYKGMSIFPAGLGTALAHAMVTQQNTMTIAQIISHGLCGHWINLYHKRKIPPPAPPIDVEQAKSTLERPNFGYGIERALYEIDPNVPCLSPMFDRHYILTPADLLRGLEQVAPARMKDHEPVDRHIAAFLMVRFRRIEDWILKALTGYDEPDRAAMAQITIIASLQDKLNQPVLPNLARWAAQLGEVVVNRLHNKGAREKLMKQIEDHVRAGSVSGIAALLDNPAQTAHDQAGYHNAQQRLRAIDREIREIEDVLNESHRFQRGYGRQLASVAAGIIGSIGLFLIVGWFTLKG